MQRSVALSEAARSLQFNARELQRQHHARRTESAPALLRSPRLWILAPSVRTATISSHTESFAAERLWKACTCVVLARTPVEVSNSAAQLVNWFVFCSLFRCDGRCWSQLRPHRLQRSWPLHALRRLTSLVVGRGVCFQHLRHLLPGLSRMDFCQLQTRLSLVIARFANVIVWLSKRVGQTQSSDSDTT